MKKTIAIIAVILGIIIGGYAIAPKPPVPTLKEIFGGGEIISDVVIYDSQPTYIWEQYLTGEDASKRTYITKDYDNPLSDNPKDRILIQSSGLLHYVENGEFKDLLPLPFPEGKQIAKEGVRHFMMNLPTWGNVKLENNGKQVKVYDEVGQPIYVFKDPLVVPMGKNPYKVVDQGGKKIRETKDINEKMGKDEKITKNDVAIGVEFIVENNKIYFKAPIGLTYPLEAYDATDTASTNQKDAMMRESDVTYNYGALTTMDVFLPAGNQQRDLIHFDLSAGSGTISAIKLYLYCNSTGSPAPNATAHELTQTSWTEGTGTGSATGDGATWNTYDGTNTWTSAGGDFDATVIHTATTVATTWITWDLIEPGASGTGLTLTWGDPVHLLLKSITDSAEAWASFNTKNNASNKPYIEITYTAIPAAPVVSPPPIIY